MVDGSEYYRKHRNELLDRFHQHPDEWRSLLTDTCNTSAAERIIIDARDDFKKLIPRLPYIGGDDHPWTGVVIRAGICLALFRAMKTRGFTAEETGKLLYDAAERREPKPMNILGNMPRELREIMAISLLRRPYSGSFREQRIKHQIGRYTASNR